MFGHQGIGEMCLSGPTPGQGGHENPVGSAQSANLDFAEQMGHGYLSLLSVVICFVLRFII
jgi:hypothetical protein